MEVVREDMIEWWGEHADPTLRRGLLYKDIKLGTEVAEEGTLKPRSDLSGTSRYIETSI